MDRRRFLSLLSSAPWLARPISSLPAFTTPSQAEAESWELLLEQPGQAPVSAAKFALPESGEQTVHHSVNGFRIDAKIRRTEQLWEFSAELSSREKKMCFLSLVRSYGEDTKPLNFSGPVPSSAVYRQSPHNPAAYTVGGHLQSVPMVALETASGIEIAICDTPAHFDNYTTQTFHLQERRVAIASGDRGLQWDAASQGFKPIPRNAGEHASDVAVLQPHFFPVDAHNHHTFHAVFIRMPNVELPRLRQGINQAITQRWSTEPIRDLLGFTYFGTSYMNLRVNETGHSHYWVVPAIEYCNKQYSRDSFWISMVLPPEYSQSCFENEAANDMDFIGAERQLFTLVWAYRNHLDGGAVDKVRVERILRIVEAQAPGGWYSGFYTKARKLGCWQGWADIIAFDRDDTISNNQGLFVVALMCAEAMGIKTHVPVEQASENYRSLFNAQLGAYPLSRQRTGILAVDPLMGDLLAQTLLNRKLLPSQHVLAHYEAMKTRARTSNGFKIVCAPDGSYLPRDQYNAREFTASFGSNDKDGSYQCGGSWYLYDMQMLMAAWLHGAKDAEDEMIWRTRLEFAKGGTTHEHIDTVTGEAFKPNMGWNSGSYGIWKGLIKSGKATDHFFREIDALRA